MRSGQLCAQAHAASTAARLAALHELRAPVACSEYADAGAGTTSVERSSDRGDPRPRPTLRLNSRLDLAPAARCGRRLRTARPMNAGEPKPARILELDAELARDLDPSDARLARETAVAAVMRVEPGPWTPPALPRGPTGPVGLLVLDGLLERHVELAGVGCAELLGKRDLVHPWEREEGEPSLPFSVVWNVLEPTRVAVLDGAFVQIVARWPAVTAELFARMARTGHSLAVHFAITCFVGLELRLFILFWHLADRFGQVERGGTVVPLRLTHHTLARLIRARRPSVTASLGALAERGLVTRSDDGTWVLHGDPQDQFERLRAKIAPGGVDQRSEDATAAEGAAGAVRQLFRRDG